MGTAPDTRSAIVESAVDAFAERGFDGTSTRDLAGRVGVNVATLNYHFGSKDGVYAAAVDEVYRRLRAEAGPILAVGSDDPRRLVEALWRSAQQNRAGVRILMREVIDRGELRSSTSADHFVPMLDEGARLVSAALQIDPAQARQLIATMGFLLARFAIQTPGSLRLIFGLPASADDAAVDAQVVQSLVTVFRGFCS